MGHSESNDIALNEITTLKQRVSELEAETRRLTQKKQLYQTDQIEVYQAWERLHDLFMQAPAAITILRGPEHIFELANPNYLQLVGSQRNIIAKPIRMALPELAGQGFYELLDNVYQTGKPFIGNEVFAQLARHEDATLTDAYFNFVYQPLRNADDQVEGIFVHAVEVTELVRSRQKAEQLANELGAILDSLPDAVYIGDSTGIYRTNRLGLEMLGLDTIKELNLYTDKLIPKIQIRSAETGQIVSSDETVFTKALQGESAVGEFIVYNAKQDCDIIIRSSGAPLRLGEEVIGAIAIHTDITSQKQAEQMQKELDYLKDLFLSIVSHELKNPLTTIKGYAQLLARSLAIQAKIVPGEPKWLTEQAKQERSIQHVIHQTIRMQEMIQQLRDYSSIQSQKLDLQRKADVDLGQLLTRVVEQQQLSGVTRGIHLQLENQQILVNVDENRLEQVLDNLLSNALKYSPENSEISLGVKLLTPPLDALSSLTLSSPEALIWVKDEGLGISPKDQAHIFDRFYRVRSANTTRIEGLGLGLYVSYELIKAHGGRMWVESEIGKGSTFYIAIPLF